MIYNKGDIVEIIDESAFYFGALGLIDAVYEDAEYEYFVVFQMIDELTGDIEVYEECYYKENQIQLFRGEC